MHTASISRLLGFGHLLQLVMHVYVHAHAGTCVRACVCACVRACGRVRTLLRLTPPSAPNKTCYLKCAPLATSRRCGAPLGLLGTCSHLSSGPRAPGLHHHHALVHSWRTLLQQTGYHVLFEQEMLAHDDDDDDDVADDADDDMIPTVPEGHKHRATTPENLGKSRGPPQNPAETPQNPRRDPAEPSERPPQSPLRGKFPRRASQRVCPSDGDPPELLK